MLEIRKYLKNYSKTTKGKEKLRKLFNIAKDEKEINNFEFWLLIYAYVECRMVLNTCDKLGISKPLYHIKLNIALLKMDYVVKKLDKIYTL